MKLLILLCLAFSIAFAKHEKYDGHVLYDVYPNNMNEILEVNNVANKLNLDIWSYANLQKPGQIFVSGPQIKLFENALKAVGVTYKATVDNIKELLEQEEENLGTSAPKGYRYGTDLNLSCIYSYDETLEYLAAIAAEYPNTTNLVDGGSSWEGRPIKYLEISTTNFQNSSKPVIFLQSLLHAREWITLPTTLYAIHKLVVDVTESDVVDGIDWIVSPIANPDGYIWSQTNDRFWRKNRRTGLLPNDTCVGVDLNRNFDVDWAKLSPTNVCSITYHGIGPNSESETQIVIDILWKYKSRLVMFSDIHSYGSMLLYGWGDGSLIPNALQVHLAAVRMAQAIDMVKWHSKPYYVVGNTVSILNYLVSGSSTDYGSYIQVPYSITYELPGFLGASGVNGFLVDPDFIQQAAFETWESIVAGGRHVLDSNYTTSWE